MHFVLFQPNIPQNTGNIIRLSANLGFDLHLIHPLGFAWDDKKLKRAGMDYTDLANVYHYANWKDFYQKFKQKRIWVVTTKANQSVFSVEFDSQDMLLFGNETSGLPLEIHQTITDCHKIRLPMKINNRSINLANSVAAVGYLALKQIIDSNCLVIE